MSPTPKLLSANSGVGDVQVIEPRAASNPNGTTQTTQTTIIASISTAVGLFILLVGFFIWWVLRHRNRTAKVKSEKLEQEVNARVRRVAEQVLRPDWQPELAPQPRRFTYMDPVPAARTVCPMCNIGGRGALNCPYCSYYHQRLRAGLVNGNNWYTDEQFKESMRAWKGDMPPRIESASDDESDTQDRPATPAKAFLPALDTLPDLPDIPRHSRWGNPGTPPRGTWSRPNTSSHVSEAETEQS